MELPFECISESDAQTEAVGAAFARWLLRHRETGECSFAAMYGDLGAGKTAFVRGAASVIAPQAYVQSPTYTVVNEYRGMECDLLHFDFYRIDDEDSLYSIGYWEYLDRDAVAFGEWSEKIPYALPEKYYTVTIEKTDGFSGRRIRIAAHGE